ncbi:hypothetical protein [Streptomyces sp. NPDC020298]|uniref:hypothetical protein n=1 Tax=unclassified Streptomyces TaxID=2593676 RepID=UPI0033D6E05A
MTLAVLVQGAGFGHGAPPAALVVSVFVRQLRGDAAPVSAGPPGFLEGGGDGLAALGAAGAAPLVAPAV